MKKIQTQTLGNIQHITAASFEIAKRFKACEALFCVFTADAKSAEQLKRELRFFLPDVAVSIFPDWEILPYDPFSPHQDITSERLRLLHSLQHGYQGIVIAGIHTVMRRLAPKSFMAHYAFSLKVGDTLDLGTYPLQLENSGYTRVSQVITHGEFALRGSILDFYPMGSKAPLRIEFFDNEISTIRHFDPDTQRSTDPLDSIEFFPAREYPLLPDSIKRFQQEWIRLFPESTLNSPVYKAITQKRGASGAENYLPLFFDHTDFFLSYLPADAELIHYGDTYQRALQFWEEIESRYGIFKYDLDRPALSPLTAFFHPTEVFTATKKLSQLKLVKDTQKETLNQSNFLMNALPEVYFNGQAERPFLALDTFLKETDKRILIAAEGPGRREMLVEHLQRAALTPTLVESWSDFLSRKAPLSLAIAPLEEGLAPTQSDFILLTEKQLFTQFVPQQRRRSSTTSQKGTVIRDILELAIGDAVVHIDHGIGRYQGLQTLNLGQLKSECVVIEYEGGDKLYVPIQDLHRITRYSSVDLGHVPLNRLGTDKWQRDKDKAA
ncbi:MAG: transcription-repair coupling factor, partial [Gammaproteobacteria bacterium]|nr:transcription-repair coupling factor [Gammaproteobacteria bacterium]